MSAPFTPLPRPATSDLKLERSDDGFSIDAGLLGALLDVPPSDVHGLMRRNEITSLCERGEGPHEGLYRLTFYYRGRRARLSVDAAGLIIRRSVIDIGDRWRPPEVPRPDAA